MYNYGIFAEKWGGFMNKVIGWVLVALVLFIAGILGFAAIKPDAFRIERSITINAPAEKIYPLIEDFRAWEQWSPFPDGEKVTYSGTEKGKGSITTWSGKNTGEGSREITEVVPLQMVKMKLDFPMMKTGFMTEFILKREGEGTRVIWANYGSNPYMAKIFGIFMNMDKVMGDDMQGRLISLKKSVITIPSTAKPVKKK